MSTSNQYHYGTMELIVVIPNIPLSKSSQAFSQAGIGLEAEVLFKGRGVCISHGHITWLHRYELLMGFKIIMLGKNSCTDQLFLEDGNKVEEVFGGVVADVVHLVWRDRKTVLTVLLLRGVLHDAHHSFHNIVDIGEVALAVTVVENLDGLTFHQFVGEAEIRHIGTTCRTVYCKETQAGRGDVVEFAISMGHQLVALLRGGVEAHGVVHLVVCRIRHLLVAAIDR